MSYIKNIICTLIDSEIYVPLYIHEYGKCNLMCYNNSKIICSNDFQKLLSIKTMLPHCTLHIMPCCRILKKWFPHIFYKHNIMLSMKHFFLENDFILVIDNLVELFNNVKCIFQAITLLLISYEKLFLKFPIWIKRVRTHRLINNEFIWLYAHMQIPWYWNTYMH